MNFNADSVKDLEYGIAIVSIDGYELVIQNKYTTQRLGIEAGNTLRINWLGNLKVTCIIRKPYWDALNNAVQEVKFVCEQVV